MVLHTRLPEGLAGVPAEHGELQRVLAQRRDVCMELDEKMLPLETQFANFGPVEGVDLCIALQGQTQQLQMDGATYKYRNAVGQGLSSQDTASDSSAAFGAAEVWGKGAGAWCLTLHQLVLQIETEVQGLILPAEALCKSPRSPDKPQRG